MNCFYKLFACSIIATSSAIAYGKQEANLLDVSDKLSGFVHTSNPPPFGSEGLSGAAWLDYDNDNDLDLFMTNGKGQPNALYQNNDGDFVDVTQQAGLASSSGSSGVIAGDIDNDGHIDLFLTGEGYFGFISQSPTNLYHNNGDGTFTDISGTAGVPGAETALAAAMGDINGDGLLDIYITSPGHLDMAPVFGFPSGAFGGPAMQHKNKLYLNNGDLTFSDISASAGVDGALGACIVSFNDFDTDGDSDIFVGNCNDVTLAPTPFHVYRNNGDLTFTDVAADVGLDLLGYWMGFAFGDIDNDGDEDIFASSFGPFPGAAPGQDIYEDARQHAMFLNNGDGTYSDIADEIGLADYEFGWGATFADIDNDGFLDLYFTGSLPLLGVNGPGLANPGRLFINNRNGGFNQASQVQSGGDLSGRFTSGVAKADFNNDGYVDLVIKTETLIDPATGTLVDLGTPVLLENAGGRNRSITVRLHTANGQATAVGARISLFSRQGFQVRSIYAGSSFASGESPWPTFGTKRNRWAALWVTWPSGNIEFFGWKRTKGITDLTEGTGYFSFPRW